MKNLVIIVHTNLQQDIADRLRSLKEVHGFTFSHVEGHGAQSEHDPFLSERDKVVGYTPHLRVEILLEDADVETVLDAVRMHTTDNSVHRQGIYWVTAVEKNGYL